MEPNQATEKAVDAGRPMFLSLPITKVDEEKRMVYGTMTTEDLDSQGDITDYDSACKALESWPGNVREQHDNKKAVGSAVEIMKNDTGRKVDVGVYVSKGAPDTWEKVLDKTLKGFSFGVPVGKFTRTPTTTEITKADGSKEQRKCNRLHVETFSELSLVDNPANPSAQIYMVKSVDGELEATENMVEKLTEDASDYADPGYQDDKKKRYPLDTEEHVRAAASYFGRPRNRKKYSKDQQEKIDSKIGAAKQTNLAAFGIRRQEIDDFKSCAQNRRYGQLLLKIWRIPVDRVPLLRPAQRPLLVYRLA